MWTLYLNIQLSLNPVYLQWFFGESFDPFLHQQSIKEATVNCTLSSELFINWKKKPRYHIHIIHRLQKKQHLFSQRTRCTIDLAIVLTASIQVILYEKWICVMCLETENDFSHRNTQQWVIARVCSIVFMSWGKVVAGRRGGGGLDPTPDHQI